MLVNRTPEGYWGRPWTQEEIEYLQDNYTTKKAKDIAEYLERSYQAVVMRASQLGLKSRHRTGVNSLRKDYFRLIDTPMKAWVLGLLTADGSISKAGQLKLELHQKDLGIVEAVRDELAPDARISFYNTRTTPMSRFMVSDTQLINDLASHHVVNAKTLITQWPTDLPDALENSYICGYFDGDGAIHRTHPLRWAITGGNREFLVAIQERIETHIGLHIGGPYVDKRHNAAWSIILTGERVRILDEWIHRDVPGLARKRLT